MKQEISELTKLEREIQYLKETVLEELNNNVNLILDHLQLEHPILKEEERKDGKTRLEENRKKISDSINFVRENILKLNIIYDEIKKSSFKERN